MKEKKLKFFIYKKIHYNYPLSLLELLKNIHKNYIKGAEYIVEFSFDIIDNPLYFNNKEEYLFYKDCKIYTKDIIETYNLDIVNGFTKNEVDYGEYKEYHSNIDIYLINIKSIFEKELKNINLKIIKFEESKISNGFYKFYISLIDDKKDLIEEKINNILKDIGNENPFKVKENIIISNVFECINNLDGDKIEFDKNDIEDSKKLYTKNYKQGKSIKLKYIHLFETKKYICSLERILIQLYIQGKIKDYKLYDIYYEGISNKDEVYVYEITKNNIDYLSTNFNKLKNSYKLALWEKINRQKKIESNEYITIDISEEKDYIKINYNGKSEILHKKDNNFLNVLYFLLINNKLITHREFKSNLDIDTSDGHIKDSFIKKISNIIDTTKYDICDTSKGYIIKIID